MKTTLTHRIAALAAAVTVTFSIVWAHASEAYPAASPAPLLLAQACRAGG